MVLGAAAANGITECSVITAGGMAKRSAAMWHRYPVNMPAPRLRRGLGMPPTDTGERCTSGTPLHRNCSTITVGRQVVRPLIPVGCSRGKHI